MVFQMLKKSTVEKEDIGSTSKHFTHTFFKACFQKANLLGANNFCVAQLMEFVFGRAENIAGKGIYQNFIFHNVLKTFRIRFIKR